MSLLTTARQIHSVEARHAAHIRLLRGQTPWVSNADDLATNLPTRALRPRPTPPSQTWTSPLSWPTTYSAADVAAAFDEALTPAEVLDASQAGGLIQ